MNNVGQKWQDELCAYRYPVDLSEANLRDFERIKEAGSWFAQSLECGDRKETMAFEDRFRENAQKGNLEAWYEVVFWKTLSDKSTADVIKMLKGTDGGELLEPCKAFIQNRERGQFMSFSDKLHKNGFSGAMIVPATFLAFLCPKRFPMVDRHIVQWARVNHEEHDYSCCEPEGPALVVEPRLNTGLDYWKRADWQFYVSWIEWCQFAASRLTELRGWEWRARDVEMAVFTAQRGGKGHELPSLCKY